MVLAGQMVTRDKQTSWSFEEQLHIASEKILYWLGCFVVSLLAQSMLKMDILWRAPLPGGPKIIAVNHPTSTDPFFVLTMLSEQMSVLVTGGAFTVPVFGAYLRRAGHVPVIRNGGGATVEAARRLLEAGRTVVVFPEGALSPLEGGIDFHKPHSGVARLALSTGAPVIPVGIGLQPERIRFVDTKIDGESAAGRLYLRGPYAITVGEPITFEGDVEDREHASSVSERIMQRIISLSQESTHRIETSPTFVPSSEPSLAKKAMRRFATVSSLDRPAWLAR